MGLASPTHPGMQIHIRRSNALRVATGVALPRQVSIRRSSTRLPPAALLSEELRADLMRWTSDAPPVMELLSDMEDEVEISSEERAVVAEHFARKQTLANWVKAELGPHTIVSWVDIQGIERTVGTSRPQHRDQDGPA
jgi:hypothetical protein